MNVVHCEILLLGRPNVIELSLIRRPDNGSYTQGMLSVYINWNLIGYSQTFKDIISELETVTDG